VIIRALSVKFREIRSINCSKSRVEVSFINRAGKKPGSPLP
jgi:hypothetical protein